MAERSDLTDTVKLVAGELITASKNTKPGIPLMQESLSKRDAKNLSLIHISELTRPY